jgi:hypothetical protein
MSRHVSRRDRWEATGLAQYRSIDGLSVFRYKGAWWAEVGYQFHVAPAGADEVARWEAHLARLGPFKRPRNAMVEAERHAVLLRNRHGEGVRLVPPESCVAT